MGDHGVSSSSSRSPSRSADLSQNVVVQGVRELYETKVLPPEEDDFQPKLVLIGHLYDGLARDFLQCLSC